MHLTSLDDQQITDLSQYHGKPTLLLFFNLGCLGCMSRGVPLAAELARVYPGLNVVGIHSNFGRDYTLGEIHAAMHDIGTTFPVYSDVGHQVYDHYRAEGTPHWILMDETGEVVKSIFGSQPNAQQRLTYGMLELFGNE